MIGLLLLGGLAILGLAAAARDLRDDGRGTWAARTRAAERARERAARE